MNIPIKGALLGLEVLNDIFGGGGKGQSAPQSLLGATFSDYMKLNGYANLVGDALNATQRSQLQNLVNGGNIAQAAQMLQTIAVQQGLAVRPGQAGMNF